MKLALGIDIGGTSTKMALVMPDGKMVRQSRISTADQPDETAFFLALFEAIETMMKQELVDFQLAGIGAGAPSVNEREGTIENAANLPFSSRVEFVKIMEAHFGVPVFLVKDSNASTFGEMNYGAAKGMKNFILLTLGTGLGAGIVANGSIVGGQQGHGGEAGHVCVMPGGRQCGCGRLGCLETYVSATGLRRTVFEMIANTLTASTLRSISFDTMTAKIIFDAAGQGDALAREVFHYTGEVLGRALADMAAWFEPEAIFLSGGLASAGDWLVQPAAESLERYALVFHKGKIPVRLSALGENDAALLGTASLVWQGKRA